MSDGRGIQCRFYARNGVGYKIFRSKRTRDYAYSWQKKFAAAGLAPNVGHKMYWWGRPGYTTQIAQMPKRRTWAFENRLDALRRKTTKARFNISDAHMGNFGYLENHCLVHIDFGTHSKPTKLCPEA